MSGRRQLRGALVALSLFGAAGAAASVRLAGSITEPAGTPRSHVIEIRGFEFHPQSLRVSAGDTVVWINRDAVPHTATSADSTIDTGLIATGARRSAVLLETGTHGYICAYHPAMTAEVVVR